MTRAFLVDYDALKHGRFTYVFLITSRHDSTWRIA